MEEQILHLKRRGRGSRPDHLQDPCSPKVLCFKAQMQTCLLLHQSRLSSVISQLHTHKLPTGRHTNTPHSHILSPHLCSKQPHLSSRPRRNHLCPCQPPAVVTLSSSRKFKRWSPLTETSFWKKKKIWKPSPLLPSRYQEFHPWYCDCLFTYFSRW